MSIEIGWLGKMTDEILLIPAERVMLYNNEIYREIFK